MMVNKHLVMTHKGEAPDHSDVGMWETLWHLQEGIRSQSHSLLLCPAKKFKNQDLSRFQTMTATLLWVLPLQHTSLLNDLTAHVDQHEPDTQPESQLHSSCSPDALGSRSDIPICL